jgi:hypothetical protein
MSERAACGLLPMVGFDSRVSEDMQLAERARTVTADRCGCTGRAAMSPDRRFEVKERARSIWCLRR